MSLLPAHLAPAAAGVIAGVLALLAAATMVARLRLRRDPEGARELWLRVRSWWVMVAVFAGAVLLGTGASIVFLAFVSYLALKEYLSLIPTRRADRRVLFWAYLAIPVQYLWVAQAWYGMFIIFVPVYMFLLLPLRMVLAGETAGFLRAAGTLHWGLMSTVFALSHTAYLLALPPEANPAGGRAGLLLYLVLLTELNDVAQYVWGRLLGRRPVVPKVSPRKTVEGLAGGMLTTTALALALAPLLTPLTPLEALGAGLLVGLGGFAGDVTLSAVKRDIGVKDSGTLIPGHGGILDRIDSLTYTAPLFFHYVFYLHY